MSSLLTSPLRLFFVGFLRTRRFARHFRRFLLLETLTRSNVKRELSATQAHALREAAHAESAALIQSLDTRLEGLTQLESDTLRLRHGLNQVEHEKPLGWRQHLWYSYKNPFNLLLTVLAALSWVTDVVYASPGEADWSAVIIIVVMVVLSTLIRFVQERRSNNAAEKLKAMVSNTATVLRYDPEQPGGARHPLQIELPIDQLVPGDMVRLSAGDMIPADLRVLMAKDLFLGQAALTGESLPVEKFAHIGGEGSKNPLELDNLLFMGTNVVSGSATAVVLTTGSHTYFGALAQRVSAVDTTPTAFQAGVNRVSWLLIRFMLMMAPLVLLINGFTKGEWGDALLFALAIAVGLTPEMLPMIVTSTLARGAVVLSRQKVIVKHLDAMQNFGAMDVLCTDKTGTLTQDKICLARHTDVLGKESDDVLELAYLNSYYQTGLKNLLDVAVLEHTEVQRELDPARNFRKIDEIPFDFSRRRMSVVVSAQDEHRLICKGAVEEMLSVCTRVRYSDDREEALTPALLVRIREITHDLNEDGLRVIAVATREYTQGKAAYSVADEADLTLVGYIAFLDPPKESTEPALAALAAHGITVKVLTGDNERVTAKVCREVGIQVDRVRLGHELDAMSDEALKNAVARDHVFARLTPGQKERVVLALKAQGHVVGFIGDGINDAAALRAADIGISVDSGVDIAKEAADIILLEKSLMVLEEGVVQGRKTFANMLKYIKMTASSNFGNVFSVIVASIFIPFLPMLPIQLLVQNLLYDISQIAVPFDNVDEELVKSPQRWNSAELGRFMLVFGPLSSIFDILTFAFLWFVIGANSEAYQSLFHSGWFIVGLITQTLVVHMIRTAKLPFIESRAALPLLLTTLAVVCVGIYLPMGPFAAWIKLQAVPVYYFAFVFAAVLGYILLTQLVKTWYIRRWGWQ